MATLHTYEVNRSNVNFVRDQINRKKSSSPYLATEQQSMSVSTDYDSFPYTRWFRGVPGRSEPTVAEREAGWRFREDKCYDLPTSVLYKEHSYPNHCFETACSTVFPCYPEYLRKYADRDKMSVMLNKSCTVQYR
jgi:hypothetical protein